MASNTEIAQPQPRLRSISQHDSQNRPIAMSRSSSSNSSRPENRLRPKSRGSTTSLQSVGVGNAFQPQPLPPPPQQQQPQQPIMPSQQQYMMPQAPYPSQNFHNQSPEESMMQYQQQLGQMQHAQHMMENAHLQHFDRPHSQHSFHHDMSSYPMQYPNGMPQYAMSHHAMQHMRHHSEHYEGSPAPEDSNNENGGAKRRKGAASSMANDAELKRLLEQNGPKTLKQVAAEVQSAESNGGKAEKAKQVFAMLWLRENCQKSTNSVRRDRVFARYTERCGNERVPTLNPASFGKLVRIIFPNVQTRRLGVRGESKYHYVDLSLVDEETYQHHPTLERPESSGSIAPARPGSSALNSKNFVQNDGTADDSNLHIDATVEIADFPAPSASFAIRPATAGAGTSTVQEVVKMDCKYLNTATIRIPTINMSLNMINHLPALRPNLPATMATYLAMPSDNSLSQADLGSQDTPIELPDIHQYLAGQKYDHHIAKLLADLYRSYCIDVIDAFRKCKEKSFFSHHSAFNGKMTVPVSKLFTLECVAPWITECDMRMYKQIVRFLAPLAQQDVPDTVWRTFNRIGARLVAHLVAAFEEKCPVHVVSAKVVPAARFTNLLKKLQGANRAALKLNQLLEHAEHRTQMWLDLMVHLNPEGIMDDSTPPPECLVNVKGILMHDLRTLLAPVDDLKHLVAQADQDPDSAFAIFLAEPANTIGVLPREDRYVSLLYRWIQWLEKLSTGFEGHHPQCMLDWHNRFWRSITSQLLSSDALSYSAWLSLESFATQMLSYMTQMEGFLLTSDQHELLEQKEEEKKTQEQDLQELRATKRKRDTEDVGGAERLQIQPPTKIEVDPATAVSSPFPSPIVETRNNPIDDQDTDLDELHQGGPLDLPSFRTGFSSPFKQNERNPFGKPTESTIDDSGIGLSMEDQADIAGADKDVKQYNKRDWLLSSDPAEAGLSGLGVIV